MCYYTYIMCNENYKRVRSTHKNKRKTGGTIYEIKR